MFSSLFRLLEPTPELESGVERFRYERKFRIERLSYQEVRLIILQHPSLFVEIFKPRWINNLYFEGPGLGSARDNLDGVASRTKTRIRWYGDLRGVAERPVLEFKIKRGLVGRKKSHVLGPMDIDRGLSVESVKHAWRTAGAPRLEGLYLDWLEPMLINRYLRRYFRTADGKFRLTLDSDMEFFPFRTSGPRFDRRTSLEDTLVLELKYDKEADLDAWAVAQALPFRAGKNSKYLTGMQLLYPYERLRD